MGIVGEPCSKRQGERIDVPLQAVVYDRLCASENRQIQTIGHIITPNSKMAFLINSGLSRLTTERTTVPLNDENQMSNHVLATKMIVSEINSITSRLFHPMQNGV